MSSKTFTISGFTHDSLMVLAERRGETPEDILMLAIALLTIADDANITGKRMVIMDKDDIGDNHHTLSVFEDFSVIKEILSDQHDITLHDD